MSLLPHGPHDAGGQSCGRGTPSTLSSRGRQPGIKAFTKPLAPCTPKVRDTGGGWPSWAMRWSLGVSPNLGGLHWGACGRISELWCMQDPRLLGLEKAAQPPRPPGRSPLAADAPPQSSCGNHGLPRCDGQAQLASLCRPLKAPSVYLLQLYGPAPPKPHSRDRVSAHALRPPPRCLA